MIRVALILAFFALAAQADSIKDNRGDTAEINRTIDACLKTQDGSEACIGQATEACRKLEIGAANPIQQLGWCAGAEAQVWQDRMTADFAELTTLLQDGPTLKDFRAQQAAWQAYSQNFFPYDRATATFPYRIWGDASLLPLIAVRALQVRDILLIVQDCFDPNSSIPFEPLCAEIAETS